MRFTWQWRWFYIFRSWIWFCWFWFNIESEWKDRWRIIRLRKHFKTAEDHPHGKKYLQFPDVFIIFIYLTWFWQSNCLIMQISQLIVICCLWQLYCWLMRIACCCILGRIILNRTFSWFTCSSNWCHCWGRRKTGIFSLGLTRCQIWNWFCNLLFHFWNSLLKCAYYWSTICSLGTINNNFLK